MEVRERGAVGPEGGSMNQHRLYLAGPMSGLPEHNHPAFHRAAEQLRAAGYIVTNPAENGLPTEDTPWIDHMRRDITLMMARSNAVATLPGVSQSRGALAEVRLAKGLGFAVMTVDEWLHMAQPAAPANAATHAKQEAAA